MTRHPRSKSMIKWGLDLKVVRSSRSRKITLTAIFASLSMVLGLFNFGFETMLYPFIVTTGLPCLYGLTISHLFMALYHGTGGLDFLTALLLLPAKFLLYKKGFMSYPVHCLSLGVWLPLFKTFSGIIPMTAFPFLACMQTGHELAYGFVGIILASRIRKRYYI